MCYCEEGIVCPEEGRGRLALLPQAGAQLNLSRGKEAGKETSPECWVAPSVLTGAHGERLESKVALHSSAGHRCTRGVGRGCHEPPNSCDARPGSPWSYNALHSVHPISTAPRQPGRCLIPGRVQRLCVPVQTTRHSQRERRVHSGYSQRGKGHAQQSSPWPCSARTSQLPLLAPPISTQAQGQGVGTPSAVDQRGLESCCFLRHKEINK